MFNIFKQIKQLKMEKQNLELEVFALREALDRANTANRELADVVQKLTKEFNEAIERVRYLDGQIKMMDAQKKASTQFNDRDRNY